MPDRTACRHLITAALIACLPLSALADQPAVAQEPAEPVPLRRTEVEEKPKTADAETREEAGDQQKEKQPTEEELRRRMNELEQELREAREAFQQRMQKERQKVEKVEHKKVDDIVLPENPTREQSEAYVAELREAAKNKRSFSSADPIVDKLKQLPEEHYDLLMTEMANRSTLRYFANYAIRGIDPEVMRKRFVETLKDNENNIGVIVMNGWTLDVRQVVLDKVRSADASLTPAWFQAAVEVAEPDLYPKLHEITIGSRYASQYLNMLRALPDYDLGHTVNVCWKRASEGKLSVSSSSFAPLAAELGNIDALGILIEQLRTSSSYFVSASTYNIRRTNVLRHIDFRGSNTEIQEWFNENRDRLEFDHLRKRFFLPDES